MIDTERIDSHCCAEPSDLCTPHPQTFHTKHGLATSSHNRWTVFGYTIGRPHRFCLFNVRLLRLTAGILNKDHFHTDMKKLDCVLNSKYR